MPVYGMKRSGEAIMVKADNQAQAVRAACQTVITDIETLSPNGIADRVSEGGTIIRADAVLGNESEGENENGAH